MRKIPRKLFSLFAAGALAAVYAVAGANGVPASAAPTCPTGSLAPGTYSSLTISGFCNLDSGDVTVVGGLMIAPSGGLNAAFNGSNLTVNGGLFVNGGLLVLGCEPEAFPCFNDPNGQSGGTAGFQTSDRIRGGLHASGAILMLVHHSTISGGVSQLGGGGGVGCAGLFGGNGPPPYTTYEDNTIRGGATVEGLHTCWSGFFRNTVEGGVNWNNNITWDGTPESSFQDTILHGDEDGNEIAGNHIHGDLNCFGNFPAIQFGDSGGSPNQVSGSVNGQCTAVV